MGETYRKEAGDSRKTAEGSKYCGGWMSNVRIWRAEGEETEELFLYPRSDCEGSLSHLQWAQ
jgi:hypothetical protein